MARVVVTGASMAPTLLAGDRLWLLPLPARVGDVVAVPDPRAADRLLVKRVVERRGDELVVAGDAPDLSTDSRSFGPVSRRGVVGRAVFRYAPRDRIGWLRRQRPT